VLLDDKRTEVVRWNFYNGWISKWEGPDLSAKSNEVAIETLEIAHEGLELA
jgi:phage tail-like protein